MMLRAKRFGARGLFTLGAWALVGCGGAATGEIGGAGPAPEVGSARASVVLAASGSRLLAQAYESDEAIRFRYFEDRQLGTKCAFGHDENGDLRCLPSREEKLLFLDATCSAEPATWNGWPSYPPMAVGDWLVDEVGEPCEGELPTHRAFQLGEEVYPESINLPEVYELVDGRCQPAQPVGKGSPAVHRLLPQAPERFVAARIESTPIQARLKVRQVVASDGAVLNLDATTIEDAPCVLQTDGACVPAPLALPGGAMVDADCETSGYYKPEAACGTPRYAVGESGQVLELRRPEQLYARNYVTPVPQRLEDLRFVCEKTEPLPDVWAAGRDVSGIFARAEPVALGRGALRASAFRLQGAHTAFTLSDGQDPGIFQTARGTCHVVTMSDGREHCLDDAPSPPYSGYYADAACSTDLYDVSDSDAAEMLAAYYEDANLVSGVYTLVPHRGTVYHAESSGCAPVTGEVPALFGPKLLPNAAFPLVEQVVLATSP